MRTINHKTVQVRQNFQENFEILKRIWPSDEVRSLKVKRFEVQISGSTKNFRNLVNI